MASTISAVTANFGTAARNRDMARRAQEGGGEDRRVIAGPKCAFRPRRGSGFESFDLVPERPVLALVAGPDLFLRNLAECLNIALDDRHASWFQQRLGF